MLNFTVIVSPTANGAASRDTVLESDLSRKAALMQSAMGALGGGFAP